LREQLLAGALISAGEYLQAQRLREQLRAEMVALLRDVDGLVTPTTTPPAPHMTAVLNPDFGLPPSNRAPFNMSGLPALAVLCGFSSHRLPLSLQIAGRPF